jgi:acetyl-CoA carboxylase alpha subunit
VEYIDVVVAPFTELRGDRVEFDDRGVITGIGAIGEIPVAVAVQDSRVSTNTTAAIRKIQRVARFAGRFELPLVMVADGKQPDQPFSVTPGESFAAAKLSAMMSVLPVPIISVGAGKVQGLVSNMLMVGDRRLMAAHASYRISGNSGSLPRVSHTNHLEWAARECQKMGLVDQVIEMPEGGVSADPWLAVRMLREDVHAALLELSRLGPRRLIERRAHAHRELGHTEEGIAAVLGELREWQDVQQSVRSSIDDWREKLEQRVGNADWRERLEHRSPRANFQRPDLGELAARLKSRQEHLKHELLERAGRTERNDRKDNDEA